MQTQLDLLYKTESRRALASRTIGPYGLQAAPCGSFAPRATTRTIGPTTGPTTKV